MRISAVDQSVLYNTTRGSTRVRLAKESDSPELHKEILKNASPRELVALAGNEHISDEIVKELVVLSERYKGIAMALLENKGE